MKFDVVVCLDDLTRESYWQAKDFMYDLVRLPAFLCANLDIGKSPRHGEGHHLRAGFDLQHFLNLCRDQAGQLNWEAHYWALPDFAAAYLSAHIPDKALVIGYEMPAWLRRLVDARGVTWLDLRMSPLRFASDLYIAMTTNDPDLYARLHPHAASMDDIFAHACLMAAQVRLRHRHHAKVPADAVGPWVYIGQTEADASLIKPEGGFVRVAEHAHALRELVGTAPMLYKPHPGAGAFAQREHAQLQALLGRTVEGCGLETYEMIAAEVPFRFVGLSSGALQEAQWFGKCAVTLAPPICTPGFSEVHDAGAYLQIPAHEFMSEPLWASVLHPEGRRARPMRLPERANHLRELHNTWWGYASHTFRHSDFYQQLFASHVGRTQAADPGAAADVPALRQTVSELQHQVQSLQDTLRVALSGLARREPDVLVTQGGAGR
jgi:hypothetical protein